MTDANRTEAQAELKNVMADAFVNQTLWTTDWSAVQLQRCDWLSCFFVTFAYPVTRLACNQSYLQTQTQVEQYQIVPVIYVSKSRDPIVNLYDSHLQNRR